MSLDRTHKDAELLRKLSEPLPWIGVYVAAASLVCTLAMAADVFHGLRHKKYWFPSKYFSLNAMSLTLLAVSMKLPVDLTTRMYTVTDRLAKVSSLALMSTCMANFLTSLGSMSNQDILMNVTALGILVITVIVNVFIQVFQLRSFLRGRLAFSEEILVIGCMLTLLVVFGSSALMLAFTKKYLETKYHEMHKTALSEEQGEIGRVTADKLRLSVKRYWVMAQTSCPQFVIARSVTCAASGVVSLLIALILIEAQIRMSMSASHKILSMSYSDYGWSTKLILLVQTIGVIVGTIAPASRLLIAVRFRSSNNCDKGISFKCAFKVEEYWTQKMVDWKQRSISFNIRRLKSRQILYDTRAKILKFCICVQSMIVLSSKLVLFLFVCIASPFVSCFNFIQRLTMGKRVFAESACMCNRDLTGNSKLSIERYVMQLEGEAELPRQALGNICKEVDRAIQRGKLRKPQNLFKLLYKSCNFNGVLEFDSRQVPDLHSLELPYCWSLPIVTLTSIAIALPNVQRGKSNFLLKSVTEGLSFVNRIDKDLDRKGGLSSIRKAADIVWVGLDLHRKWQDKDLKETSRNCESSKEVLQDLSTKAEMIVSEFNGDVNNHLMKNPLYWPAKVIAANAMYKISRTLLHVCDTENETDDRLFERISIMIADIMSACLTNLARVITMKCHRNAIEEMYKSVRKAALLLGETEDVLALLQQRELPCLDPDQAAYIEEWRAFIKLNNKNGQDSVPTANVSLQASRPKEEDYVIIEVKERQLQSSR